MTSPRPSSRTKRKRPPSRREVGIGAQGGVEAAVDGTQVTVPGAVETRQRRRDDVADELVGRRRHEARRPDRIADPRRQRVGQAAQLQGARDVSWIAGSVLSCNDIEQSAQRVDAHRLTGGTEPHDRAVGRHERSGDAGAGIACPALSARRGGHAAHGRPEPEDVKTPSQARVTSPSTTSAVIPVALLVSWLSPGSQTAACPTASRRAPRRRR